ncbi:hypothetical protein GRI44_07055 [Altererythrobacter confluentis]|uniref:Uncharacterized protein n=1 Tax=Allopontixanthobacter confluentis TaxID=1849021 RepID=A0A6L7GGA8_9SPHN|nr:hypothetical protein [Allopontixanthobacter confluentis]MXP14506.1 hypothetical protein [Allopontixanthobacter confluentis]
MSGESFSDLFSLPGADEIRHWEAEHARMGEAIKQLQEKRIYLERLIAAAKGEASPVALSAPKRADGKLKPGTWMHAVAEIVLEHPEGISYDDLRDRMVGELGETVRKKPSQKGFYGALRRLERDEVIVRHRGCAFSPAGFKRYTDKVERGEIDPVKGNDYRHSPMADAIIAYIKKHGPTKAVALREHLSSKSQFADSMKNGSAIYNILTRLVERDELSHNREASTFGLFDEKEALSAPTDKASGSGEASTSSFDTSPLFRVVK